jgi:hypothetical protein
MIILANVLLLAQVHYMVMLQLRLAKLVTLNVQNVMVLILLIVNHVLMGFT